MAVAGPGAIAAVILVPLLAWRVYVRIRRMVGRQRLSKVRPWITIVVFPLLVVLLGALTLRHPVGLLVLAAGVIAGSLLGVYGIKKTTFEPTPTGLYYTPNAHLGIALSVLFVARLAYRGVEIYLMAPGQVDDFARSPLTLGIFGILASYYVSYAVGLVRWRWAVLRRKREREAKDSAPV